MSSVASKLVALVAVLHFGFFIAEFFLWKMIGPRLLKVPPDDPSNLIENTKVIAANQGIYNLFLAVGLALLLWFKWPIAPSEGAITADATKVIVLFLGFIAFAGVFGAYSLGSWLLLVLQCAPAAIAIAVILRGTTT